MVKERGVRKLHNMTGLQVDVDLGAQRRPMTLGPIVQLNRSKLSFLHGAISGVDGCSPLSLETMIAD